MFRFLVVALSREFPCIYTLKDFKKEVASFLGTMEDNTTNAAGHHYHPDGEVCENEYFVPLIEQLVASQSHFFVGTPGSA